jgi:GNAT superfamily N-acetyltransferase
MAPVVRRASLSDTEAILELATAFATSFSVDSLAFAKNFTTLLSQPDAALLVAEVDARVVGYILGFVHPTLYANGMVAWVEEIMVASNCRRHGIGRSLMEAFEQWAADHQAGLVALATRRAADFYMALGYAESATYFRKLL